MLETKNKDFNIPLCFDYKFKKMFGDSNNIERLESLISILFNVPYKYVKGNINILNNEKLINHNNQKKGIMDVYLELTLINGKYKIDIEVSSKILSKSTIDRNILYNSYVFSNQLKKGKNYNLLLPSITICLDKGLENINEDNILNIYTLKNQDNIELTKKLQIWHINIEKCYNIWYSNDVNKYDENEQNIILLGALLNTNNINEFNKCLGGIPMDKDIKEEIKETNEELNEYDELMSWYDYDRDQLAIRNGEISDALERGKKQKNIENAKNFKNLGVDINIISKATGLSVEEINKL